MNRWRVGAAWLIVVALAFSGCATQPTPSDETPDPLLGTVEGRVLDGLGFPVAGANVTILLTQHQATTDEAGAFLIPRVEPGPLAVVAVKSGHSSQTLRGVLHEDGRARFEFRLSAAPRIEPRHITTTEDGLLACGLPLGADCGPAVPGAEARHVFPVGAGLSGIVAELEWTPPAPGISSTLRLELAAATQEACGETYESASGGSILRLAATDGFPVSGGHQCVTVWPADEAVLQQGYTLHVTFFYHLDVPDGFSALL